MANEYHEITEEFKRFIEAQEMFFVATAPIGARGHVNLSPKGLDSLRILDPKTVAYVDFVGSGIETVAHVRQNGRIVLMVCAFEGPPKIIRLHGVGTVVWPTDDGFESLRQHFPEYPGIRSMICVSVERVSDSCGYGVPVYEYKGQRTQLAAWAERKGSDRLAQYQREKNANSIDGLPGFRNPERPAIGAENTQAFEIKVQESDADILRCFSVMAQLRPHLAESEFLEQVRRQHKEFGYRLAWVEQDGKVKSVAGFLFRETLSAGRFLYVDDLVTDAAEQSRGYGRKLLQWLVEEARRSGCKQLHLDSGLQREGAHRFYERFGMTPSGYHFSLKV